jgi:copper chaperone CopZ
MPNVMVWVTKPGDGEDVPGLEAVGQRVEELDHVFGVDIRTEGSVVHVSFEGSRSEQEEIERVIREAGYEIFKVSYGEE